MDFQKDLLQKKIVYVLLFLPCSCLKIYREHVENTPRRYEYLINSAI